MGGVGAGVVVCEWPRFLAMVGSFFSILILVFAAANVRAQIAPVDTSQALAAGTKLNAVFDVACVRTDQGSKLPEARKLIPDSILQNRALNGPVLYSVGWELSRVWTRAELQKTAALDRCLRRISFDHELTPDQALPVDERLGEQEHLQAIRWTSTYPRFASLITLARKPVIAIIDTGVDLSHPDLAGNAWYNSREVAGNGIDDDGNGYVDDINGYNFKNMNASSWPASRDSFYDHGTHVAGLAAASGNGSGVVGVHSSAKIMSLNVFGDQRAISISTVENAIRYAADNGANVINISSSGNDYSSSLEETLKYAVKKGAVVVTGVGNAALEVSDLPNSPRYVTPAIYGRAINGMITVASVDVRTSRLSTFSNFSMFYAEIGAPGAVTSRSDADGLLSTLPNGNFGRLHGTSMAAPLVAGAAALAFSAQWSKGQSATPAQIEQAFAEGSRHTDAIMNTTRYGAVLDLNLFLKKFGK